MGKQSGSRWTRVLGSVPGVVSHAAAAALLALLAVSGWVWGASVILAPGDPAPALWGWDLEGNRTRVTLGQGRPAIVNFWATWCEPCREEMPRLGALHRRLGPEGLEVYGVLVEFNPDDAALAKFLQEVPVDYPLVRAPAKVLKAWGALGIVPTTYLVRPDGTIARRYVSAHPEVAQAIERDAEALLRGEPLGPLPMPKLSEPEKDAAAGKQGSGGP